MANGSNKLNILMKKEIDLINEFTENKSKLKDYIQNKDWNGLEETISELGPISENIADIDSKRHEEFSSLKSLSDDPKTNSFYQVIAKLENDDRNTCSQLYRELKLAVIKMQGVVWSIDTHVKTMSMTLYQILDEIFPHRKGKMYSDQGKPKQTHSVGPMVLNHHT